MSEEQQKEQELFIRSMFGRIAPRYDMMNRIMTGGQDLRWRKKTIQHAHLPARGLILDVGAGTGDLGREAIRQRPGFRLVSADLTMEMMHIGRERSLTSLENGSVLGWSAADAHNLPFPENAFEAVVSAFLLRNLHDISQGLADQYRVVKPGSWVVALDTNPPPKNMLTPLIQFHLHKIIPTLGRQVAGFQQEYQYLSASTEGFLQPHELSIRFQEAGFQEVGYERLMFGTISIHWGRKSVE